MPAAPSTEKTCPNCAAPTTGRFCSECGAAVGEAVCTGCRSQLSPGAKFCHRCGTAAGTQPAPATQQRSPTTALPWAVAAIAMLALIALVAGQRFGGMRAPTGAATAAPFASGTEGAPGRAPDISNLSPRERADRLFDRMMRLSSEGKADSIQFFAPMALSVYQALDSLDADLRYDFGRVAEIAGEASIATAQADSILASQSTHLLGLVLAVRAAQLRGDSTAATTFRQRLIAAEPAESAKRLTEYERHQSDILEALAEARRR